jgi:hypothetical protein
MSKTISGKGFYPVVFSNPIFVDYLYAEILCL